MAAAAITNVSVNFIFANFERKVQLETTLSSSGNDLKTLLIQNWPEGKRQITTLQHVTNAASVTKLQLCLR